MSKIIKLIVMIGVICVSTLPINAVTYNISINKLGQASLINKYNEMNYGDILCYSINLYTHVTWVKLVGGALITTTLNGSSVHTIFIRKEDIGIDTY